MKKILSVCLFTLFMGSAIAQNGTSTKSLIEQSMGEHDFNAAGLNKLSKDELKRLDDYMVFFYQAASRQAQKLPGNLEVAELVKNFKGKNVIVKRANGEYWTLDAQVWCSWCSLSEGEKVILKFSPITSLLVNGDGETEEFWTKKQVK